MRSLTDEPDLKNFGNLYMILDVAVEKIIEVVLKTIGALPKKYHSYCSILIGRLWYYTDRRHRNITIENITLAYNNELNSYQVEQLSKAVFSSFAKSILEICWSLNLNKEQFRQYFDTSDIFHLTKAHNKNKGVLILSGHLGIWEFLPHILSIEGYRGSSIYRPIDYKPLDVLIKKMRSRYGAGLIPVSGSSKKIRETLNENKLVGLLIDQNANYKNGVAIDFFNRRTLGNKGLAVLAMVTGSPVVPVFSIRMGDKFKLICGPEIPLIKTGDRRKDIELNTQKYNKVIEEYIRCFPDQWFWVHRRWKTKISSPWPGK